MLLPSQQQAKSCTVNLECHMKHAYANPKHITDVLYEY